MASKRVKDGPHWVKAWISELSALTDQFRDIETGAVDFEALGREEYHFRMALSRRDFSNSERARKVWEDAVGNYQQRIKAASKKTTEGAANGNNADESTTAFENMRRVPQNEAPAHGFSGGRTAQGTMSRSPEAAAQSGNNFGSARPSTDGDTRKDSHGHDRAGNRVALESATSVENVSGSGKPKAQSDQRRAGGVSPLRVSPISRPPARSGAVDVLNLAYAGEFGNVTLTQEQYAQLGIKFGNQQKLNRAIDSLSCKLENGESNPPNHYAELVKWASYRDDMEEKEELRASTAPHYESVSEHNARIVRESDAWIHEYCQQQKKNRKAANG